MYVNSPEEREIAKNCVAFCSALRRVEQQLRSEENSDAIIDGVLQAAAEFYGTSRASIVEADWELGVGIITHEWCADGVEHQMDMLQFLAMEMFPRWRKALSENKPIVTTNMRDLENQYPDEADFFRSYGVGGILAAPFSKRINQGFLVVDDPTLYTDDPAFLLLASYAAVLELNEIKLQQSLVAASRASRHDPDNVYINCFGGLEIIGPNGKLVGDDIKTDQGFLLLAYLILNRRHTASVDELSRIIHHFGDSDAPYKVLSNIVYRIRRPLAIIGLDKLIVGKSGTFVINPAYHIHTDFDRFEGNCRQLERTSDPDLRRALYRKAVELYKGHLLPRIEHELWHMQLDMYYQSLYLAITKGYARYKLERKEYIDALREIKNAMQIAPGDGELSMLSVLAAGYHGGRALARRYYEAAKKYLDSSQIAQIHAQLGF